MKSDLEIAQAATPRPIAELARDRLDIPDAAIEPYGRYKAKIGLDYLSSLSDRPDGLSEPAAVHMDLDDSGAVVGLF